MRLARIASVVNFSGVDLPPDGRKVRIDDNSQDRVDVIRNKRNSLALSSRPRGIYCPSKRTPTPVTAPPKPRNPAGIRRSDTRFLHLAFFSDLNVCSLKTTRRKDATRVRRLELPELYERGLRGSFSRVSLISLLIYSPVWWFLFWFFPVFVHYFYCSGYLSL